MKITKESKRLMSFFVKNNCILPLRQTNKTNALLKKLFDELTDGVSFIQSIKSKYKQLFYKMKIKPILNVSQIPRPKTFATNAIPPQIKTHIDEHALNLLTYTFHLFDRDINILFLIEDANVEHHITKYNKYVDNMLVWLYIVNKFSSKSCSTNLTIYLYHTSLVKMLPETNVIVLNENNVNTAFTKTCPTTSEIVVYRKEEWFKVFIHETFHNFGLDFSDMNIDTHHAKILSIFKVSSDVNLFEAYTEFWARLINTLFCSYHNMKNKNDLNEFLNNTEFFINFERIFAFFQMVKVLNFMDLQYNHLYNENAYIIRQTMYKEETSVLSYYVITLILFNNYQDFLSWCNINNDFLLQFKKTTANLNAFCDFIEKKYKNKSMLDGISCTEKLLSKVSSKNHQTWSFLIKNLRMTICELG